MSIHSFNFLATEKKILILVPQGAEHQAVLRAIKKFTNPPYILSIPVGNLAVTRYLKDWWKSENLNKSSINSVILIGLAGSLSTQLGVAEITLLESCLNFHHNQAGQIQQSDRFLTDLIKQYLGNKIKLVQGLTCDRVITNSTEKQALGKTFNRQVVDMESWAVLYFFRELKMPTIIMRVISDEVDQTLPNLNNIYDHQGRLQAIALAFALIRKPIAGLKLIMGSLKALKILEQITKEICFSLDIHLNKK